MTAVVKTRYHRDVTPPRRTSRTRLIVCAVIAVVVLIVGGVAVYGATRPDPNVAMCRQRAASLAASLTPAAAAELVPSCLRDPAWWRAQPN